MIDNEIVITGIGLVTPLGYGVDENWHALCQGISGLSVIDGTIAGRVKPVSDEELSSFIPLKDLRKMEHFSQYALLAAAQAMADAGLSESLPQERNRFGIYLG